MSEEKYTDYGSAIREGFAYLLRNYPEVFVIGQGLWSPWYVGSSMTDLDKEFGIDRIIDTPVSESACTGAAVGAAIAGMKPIVVHPRMDFMLYAMDSIVNEAAKWSSMMGGQATAGVTVRAIINRGGEQGAQHSQSLHSWFTHIPGLRVVMPATAIDARDLLIASVLCEDPVMFIDDRWLYSESSILPEVKEVDLTSQGPRVTNVGTQVTLAGAGYSAKLCTDVAKILASDGISAETIDIRVLNPFNSGVIVESVLKTGRLVVIDGGWSNSGFASEVIASVTEQIDPISLKSSPIRVTLPSAPAPASSALEKIYYTRAEDVAATIRASIS
jgi:pyruvate dehydrogenase E1 component beta subunit